MKRRILALFMLLAFIMPMIPNAGVQAAVSTMTQSEYDSKVNAFINDSRWKNGASWGYGKEPCISDWVCESCFAYTADFVKYMFGREAPQYGDEFSNASEIRAGDVIYAHNPHYIVVLSRSGNNLRVAEGNRGGVVKITDNEYYISGSRVVNRVWSGFNYEKAYHQVNIAGETPANLGTDFYGVILNKKDWKPISVDSDGYVRLRKETGTANQVWKFSRQSDGSYKIASAKDGKVLDVETAGDSNGLKIHTYTDVGGDNQRWFIYGQGGGYVIRPKNSSTRVIDLTSGSTESGTQVQLYDRNNTYAQIFAIYKENDVQLKAPTLKVSAGNSATNTTFTWNEVYGELRYDVKIMNSNNQYYHIEWGTSSGYGIKLPAGTYTAYVDATNYFLCKQSNIVKFTVTPSSYSVSYNANGGSGAPSSQTKTHGVNLTLSSAKPTRTGYTFKNWNTAANGSGTAYNAGGTYSANAGATLYAQWTANSYTVSFNANGGTTPTAGKAVTYNSAYGTLPTPTRTGHTFTGWYTAASGGTRVNADTKVTITANQTLYAQWSVNSYTLHVRPMGGVYTNDAGSYTEDTTLTKKYGESTGVMNPTRKGYQFAAWVPMGYGTFEPWGKTMLKPGVSPQFNNKETLAVYNNAAKGSVKIETVNKEATCPTTSAYMQKITTLGTSKPGLGGFIRGTASKANGVFYHIIIAKIPEGYNIYMANNSIGTDGKNEWLTPNKGTGQWETYIYKVTCGATGDFSTFGHVYINKTECCAPWQEEATSLTPVTWYVGFSDVYDATGVNPKGNKFIFGAGDGYLQATWRANDYTVRYNSNGGIGKMSDSAHRYDTEKALGKNTFTKQFCRFKGWNTAPDGSGTAFADGASVKNLTAENGGTVTLYAQWERSVYTESGLKEYSGYSQLSVDIHGINKPARVIAAYYKDGRLVNAEAREYTSDKEIFALIGDFDTVKVMVWDGLDGMVPLTETEVLTKQN